MYMKTIYRQIVMVTYLASILGGCKSFQNVTTVSTQAAILRTTSNSPASPISPAPSTSSLTPVPSSAAYAFPSSIDPGKRYLFYLHGRVLEDQGEPAFSPEYGAYEYREILEKLSGNGLVVISEVRPKDIDTLFYARKVAQQVRYLIEAGVPAENITVVGASKGAAITIYVSHYLMNQEVNFVLLAICHPDVVKELEQYQVLLYGNVLSIYDFKRYHGRLL